MECRKVVSADIAYAKLRITEEVSGYLLIDMHTDKILESCQLKNPIQFQYETRGLAFTAPYPKEHSSELVAKAAKDPDFEEELSSLLAGERGAYVSEDLQGLISGGSFHALEHVVIESSDMLVGGGRNEIGGISLGESGAIFIYDGTPGGSGLSRPLYERFAEAISRSSVILNQYKCRQLDGCPFCTYSYRCDNNNAPRLRWERESLHIGSWKVNSLNWTLNPFETKNHFDEV